MPEVYHAEIHTIVITHANANTTLTAILATKIRTR